MSSDQDKRSDALKVCGSKPNCVCSCDERQSHHVAAFDLSANKDSAWDKVKEVILNSSGVTIAEESGNYLRAEYKSRFFRFTDDLELFLDRDRSRIDVRSESRVGYSDLGVNRKRVEQLRQQLKDVGVVA